MPPNPPSKGSQLRGMYIQNPRNFKVGPPPPPPEKSCIRPWYQRSNLLISDFRVCDSITLDSLHKIYCMHMYGSELWNLNCRDFNVTWRKVKRIWKLPCNTHNAIVQNLTYNIDDHLDVKIAKFTHMCLNHHNDVCRSISLSKIIV